MSAQELRSDAEADWEDQDLLTLDLAAERLAGEIEVLERHISDAPDDIDLTDTRLRLERLVDAKARMGRRRR